MSKLSIYLLFSLLVLSICYSDASIISFSRLIITTSSFSEVTSIEVTFDISGYESNESVLDLSDMLTQENPSLSFKEPLSTKDSCFNDNILSFPGHSTSCIIQFNVLRLPSSSTNFPINIIVNSDTSNPNSIEYSIPFADFFTKEILGEILNISYFKYNLNTVSHTFYDPKTFEFTNSIQLGPFVYLDYPVGVDKPVVQSTKIDHMDLLLDGVLKFKSCRSYHDAPPPNGSSSDDPTHPIISMNGQMISLKNLQIVKEPVPGEEYSYFTCDIVGPGFIYEPSIHLGDGVFSEDSLRIKLSNIVAGVPLNLIEFPGDQFNFHLIDDSTHPYFNISVINSFDKQPIYHYFYLTNYTQEMSQHTFVEESGDYCKIQHITGDYLEIYLNSNCVLSYNGTDSLLDRQYALTYQYPLTNTLMHINHPKKYNDASFAIEFDRNTITTSYVIHNPNPVHRYCISVGEYTERNYELIIPDDQYFGYYISELSSDDVSKYCPKSHKGSPYPSYMVSFKDFYPPGNKKIMIPMRTPTVINNNVPIKLIEASVLTLNSPSILRVSAVSYPGDGSGPPVSFDLDNSPTFRYDYKTHQASITSVVRVTGTSSQTVYVAYENAFKNKFNQCSLFSPSGQRLTNIRTFSKVTIDTHVSPIILVGPITIADKSKLVCTLILSPKQYDGVSFHFFLYNSDRPLGPQSPLPAFADRVILHLVGNVVNLTDFLPISTVNWTRSSSTSLTTEINRAKYIVFYAVRNLNVTKPEVNLIDLTLHSVDGTVLSPHSLNTQYYPTDFSTESYIDNQPIMSVTASTSTSTPDTISAKFTGNFALDLPVETIEKALHDVILLGESKLEDVSSSATIDQIASKCIDVDFKCGDLCAPCIAGAACKSDYDCFSGACSFGICLGSDRFNDNSVLIPFSSHVTIFTVTLLVLCLYF